MTNVTDVNGRHWRLDEFAHFRERGNAVLAQPRDSDQLVVEFTAYDWYEALNEDSVTTVPAASGHFAITPVIDELDEWQPLLNAVVAWRCSYGTARPVTLDAELEPDPPILFPDGHVEERDGARYESLADYTTHQQQQRQREEARRRKRANG